MKDESMEKVFNMLGVSRNDLEMAGFNASNVSDEIMERLAERMTNCLIENFVDDLRYIAGKELDIPLSNRDGGHLGVKE
jgi:hypothetical protein